MIHKTITTPISALLFLVASAAQAGGLPDTGAPDSQASPWRNYTADMSPEQYRQTYRHNLKSARHLVESYSRKTLSSIGVPKAGIDLIGAAAAFAVTQDAGVHLGRSNLLSVGVRNAADNDRSVFLGIKVDW